MKQRGNYSPANLKRALFGAERIRKPMIKFAEVRGENGQIRERSPDI